MVENIHPPLWIRPTTSRHLQGYLLSLHGLASLAVYQSGTNTWVQWIAVGLVGVSLWFSWRRHVSLRSDASVRQACWESDGRWLLQDGRGEWRHAEEYRPIWSNPWLILVRFGSGSLLLPADAVPSELHRQLRVRLTLQPYVQDSEDGM